MKAVLIFLMPIVLLAHPGTGIVEDAKGNIFYTDLKQVWKIAPDGHKTVVVPNVHTHELFMDAQGNLFGEHLWFNGETRNTWGHFVWRLSVDGLFSKVIPDKEGFLSEYSFARDKTGTMFWANRDAACQTITKKTGSKKTTLGTHCFHNIRQVFMTRTDELVVVDFQDVKVIKPDGSLHTVAVGIADKTWRGASTGNQNAVMGVWDDAHGKIYTAVYSLRQVKCFNKDGKEVVVYSSPKDWGPSGGLVAKSEAMYVLETSATNAVRVVRVTPGSTKIL